MPEKKSKPGRGGRRPGAGRPPGTGRGGARSGAGRKPNGRRGLKVDPETFKPVTPLDISLTTARALWAAAWTPEGKLDLDLAREAHVIAKDVAPYMHPRLQQIEGNPEKPLIPPTHGDMLDRTRRLAFMFRAAIEGEVLAKRVASG